jgi:hypothetical protein
MGLKLSLGGPIFRRGPINLIGLARPFLDWDTRDPPQAFRSITQMDLIAFLSGQKDDY